MKQNSLNHNNISYPKPSNFLSPHKSQPSLSHLMATPPTSLSLSLDSTLQPLLFHSSHPLPSSSSSSSTPPSSSSSSLTFPGPSHPFLSLKLLHPSPLSFSSPPPTSSSPSPFIGTTPRRGPFLDPDGQQRLQTLKDFVFTQELEHGSVEIRHMKDEEVDPAARLLAETFVELMWMPAGYVQLLALLVKQYLLDRRRLVPHTAMLVGIYKERNGGGEEQLVGTAEVSFDALGANVSPPTPLPPRDCSYICNMAVRKNLRRKRIGWNLLKACEELIASMKTSRKEVYLHCRMIDKGPFSMYVKSGYKISKTDNYLVWVTLQRRKYLMSKKLPASNDYHSDNTSLSKELPASNDHHSDNKSLIKELPASNDTSLINTSFDDHPI